MPAINVIIPAYNEEKVIDDCLGALMAQSVTDFKVIVIDDASTDRTADKIRDFVQRFSGRIELKEFGKVGPGKARNRVAMDVTSEFVAFTDADCIPSPQWLEELLKGFTSPEIGAVGGPHRAPSKSSEFQKMVEDFFSMTSFLVDFFKAPTEKIIEVPHNPLCNVMYRTKIFKSVGGFREDLFPGEDTEIDFKIADRGFKILYNPKALVEHHRPESIQQFRKVMHAYGRAQGKLVREYGLRRKIQWIGLGVLMILAWISLGLAITGSFAGLAMGFGIFYLFFSFRPQTESRFGIFCNALQWFNGFVEGFWKNQSLPPGYRKDGA